MRIAIAIVVSLCACKGGAKQDTPAASRPPPRVTKPDRFAHLKVTIDGQPVAMKRAFIKPLPGTGRYQLYLTDKAGSCQQLLDDLFTKEQDEHSVLLDIEPGSKATISGSVAKGEQIEVAIDMLANGAELHGTLTAEGCGDER